MTKRKEDKTSRVIFLEEKQEESEILHKDETAAKDANRNDKER